MAKTLLSALEDALRTIEGFNYSGEVSRLERHNLEVGKDYVLKHPQLSRAIAMLQFSSIAAIPETARRMMDHIEYRRGTPGECCALAAVLWYISNPDDVMPDNENGAVGFLDDAAVLNHVTGDYLLPILKLTDVTRDQLYSTFDILGLGIPMNLYQSITQQISFISTLIKMCLERSSAAADDLLEKFLRGTVTQEMLLQFMSMPPYPPFAASEPPRTPVENAAPAAVRPAVFTAPVSEIPSRAPEPVAEMHEPPVQEPQPAQRVSEPAAAVDPSIPEPFSEAPETPYFTDSREWDPVRVDEEGNIHILSPRGSGIIIDAKDNSIHWVRD